MIVLLADDDEVSRKVTRLMLERLGFGVVDCAGGEAAWKAFDRHPARVVVSDWVMPDLDGLELCRKVRRRPEADYAYFILLTGEKTSRDDYRRAMDEGVDDFLTKPVDIEQLWLRLRVAERILGLTARLSRVEGALALCPGCRRVKGEFESYVPLEDYLQRLTLVSFVEEDCPECAAGLGRRRLS